MLNGLLLCSLIKNRTIPSFLNVYYCDALTSTQITLLLFMYRLCNRLPFSSNSPASLIYCHHLFPIASILNYYYYYYYYYCRSYLLPSVSCSSSCLLPATDKFFRPGGMRFLGFSILIFSVVLWFGEAGLGAAQMAPANNVITWDDLRVDDGRLLTGVFENGGNVIVVDQFGRGDSVTVQGAVDMVPENNKARVKIQIIPGIYREKVVVPQNKPYVSFIGDERFQTVITWQDKASDGNGYGGTLGTVNSASVTVLSDYFCAVGLTFQNTVVEPGNGQSGYQAVAFRIAGEKAVFYRVRFLGSQDTLLDDSGSHYFYRCFIQGSVDFIFGNGRSLYQECDLSVINSGYAIAANHRNTADEETGFSFVNCTVTGTAGPVYLGRAWGNYSRAIYAYSELGDNVRPEGWNDWHNPSRQSTAVFGEYECRGIGADRRERVAWSKALSASEAMPYLTTAYIGGEEWLRL